MIHVKSKLKPGLGVVLTAALVCSLVLIAAPVGATAETEICGCLEDTGSATAVWESTQVHTETVTVMGDYSVKLNAGHAADDWAEVQLCPTPSGITLDDMATITGGWSWWYYIATGEFTQRGTSLELYFDGPGSGFAEMTIMDKAYGVPAHGGPPTLDAWTEQPIVSTTTTGIVFGTTEAGGAIAQYPDPPTVGEAPIDDLVAHMIAAEPVGDAGDWVLTKVRPALGWIGVGTTTAYVDDISIEGTTYDLEPCYFLEPDIAMNVKTADATFTVVDCCGPVDPDTVAVTNWLVTKGEGAGVVTTVANPETSITVRMVTTGDCIITCDVVSGDYEVTLNAEKKWGEIDYTVLTAWEALHPTVEHTRADVAVDEQILIKEQVVANFLPGLVPANAGGAKITWWLLENDALDDCQDALEDLIQRFDNYEFEEGNLGWGEGCGQYGSWADDVTFIPETIINGIYATCAASDTNFVKAEGTTITPTTKTVTETDEAGGTLGEGFTNVTVEFSQVGSSGEVEPAIVVLLADYPLGKNGENAVCVEYFKFSPLPLIEYKDVQTYVDDVIDPVTEEIDPIRKMLYVFVRDYDGTPAVDEPVEYAVDGPYGLFEALLSGTGGTCGPCTDDDDYTAGIYLAGRYAVSCTRLMTAAEIDNFVADGVFASAAVAEDYAIEGVKIVSSHCEDVDVLIYVHDCYGGQEVVITRDVMVTDFCVVGETEWCFTAAGFFPKHLPDTYTGEVVLADLVLADIPDEIQGVWYHDGDWIFWVPDVGGDLTVLEGGLVADYNVLVSGECCWTIPLP